MRLTSIALASLIVCAGTARADDLPVGKYGVITGPRQNTGELGEQFGFGWLIGVAAGYQPSSTARSFSLGVSWEVLWARFGRDDPEIVQDVLWLLEMNLGLRLRRSLGSEEPLFLALTAGGTLLRTRIPLPPDMERLYLGPYAGLGVDRYLSRDYLLSIEARYGMIVGGPTSLTLVISFAFGSR